MVVGAQIPGVLLMWVGAECRSPRSQSGSAAIGSYMPPGIVPLTYLTTRHLNYNSRSLKAKLAPGCGWCREPLAQLI
jgi:hypothetical protein